MTKAIVANCETNYTYISSVRLVEIAEGCVVYSTGLESVSRCTEYVSMLPGTRKQIDGCLQRCARLVVNGRRDVPMGQVHRDIDGVDNDIHLENWRALSGNG